MSVNIFNNVQSPILVAEIPPPTETGFNMKILHSYKYLLSPSSPSPWSWSPLPPPPSLLPKMVDMASSFCVSQKLKKTTNKTSKAYESVKISSFSQLVPSYCPLSAPSFPATATLCSYVACCGDDQSGTIEEDVQLKIHTQSNFFGGQREGNMKVLLLILGKGSSF